MSVSTAISLVRKFPPPSQDALQDINLGTATILIQEGEPRTPQVRQAFKDIQLSSPAANYVFESSTQPSQGPAMYTVQHSSSDRKRLINAKEAIFKMESRMDAMEKAINMEREERRQDQEKLKELVEQEKIVILWEICDRLAQGLNDSLKETFRRSMNEELRQAINDISSNKNGSRYLPQLFTQWWVFWHNSDPLSFNLPSALDSLSEQEKAVYLSRGSFDEKVEAAAQTIWESDHRSDIEIMLRVYHMRPKNRNPIQHPAPSAASAYEFLDSICNITKGQKSTTESVIEYGTRWNSNGEEVSLFTPAPSPSNVGKGITRKREPEVASDDEGIPLKKQRREDSE